jgi:hypothetical protein
LRRGARGWERRGRNAAAQGKKGGRGSGRGEGKGAQQQQNETHAQMYFLNVKSRKQNFREMRLYGKDAPRHFVVDTLVFSSGRIFWSEFWPFYVLNFSVVQFLVVVFFVFNLFKIATPSNHAQMLNRKLSVSEEARIRRANSAEATTDSGEM